MIVNSVGKRLPIHAIQSLRIFVSLALFISIFSAASISPVAAASNGLVFNVRQNANGAVTANLAKDQISSGTLGYCGSVTLATINFTSWASPVTCSFPYSQSYASGFIKAPFSGMVTLTTSSDDGVQVQVNDWIGINNWDDHAAESDSMAIPMVAGNYYPIKIWYASGGGGGVLSLSWSWSGQSSVIVPSGSLYQSENDFDSCVARSGTGPNCPGSSALQIKQLTGASADGLYWIDLNDGSGAKATYSIMNSNHGGGGWMLAMKGKDSASTFAYDSAYWKDANLLNSERPSRNNQEDVDAKYLPFTKSRATDVMVIFPDYAASTYKGAYPSSGDGFAWSENLANNRTWQSGDGNSFDFNQGGDPSGTSACASYPSTMQTIFSNSSRCLIRKVETSYSASRVPYDPIGNGLFFSQTQIRFFGFNYASRNTGDQMYKARFGFGWNENSSTDEGSNDGSGGIGLKSGSMTITAGTRYGCCAVQGGIGGVNNNGGGSASQTNFGFELFVKNTTTITISGAATLRAQNGSSANTTYSADQGNTPTYALSPVVPGISINASTGVVTAANILGIGTYRETVTVSNALGASAVRAITIQVIAASGETDTGLTFGTNKYAWAADSDELDVTNAITMQAWVYQTSTNAGVWNMVMNKENSYELGTIGTVWSFGLQGSGGWSGVNTGISTRLNEWQHVALTRAAGSSTANFYLNGQLVWTGTADGVSTGNLTNSNQPFTISGRSTDGNTFTSPFIGTIDQVKVFRSARSQSEVVADMHNYGPTDSANLALYYDFNEATGSVLYNRISGNAFASDLSIVGSPSWVENVTTSTSQAYTVKTFTRSYLTSGGGWKVPTGVTRASALVVAGGGGGGGGEANEHGGGGGGAGGVLSSIVSLPSGLINITVGSGGAGGAPGGVGSNGVDSSLGALITAKGGGAGGTYGAGPSVGGSGGGAGSSASYKTGAEPTAGQGFKGGNVTSNTTNNRHGGGGGGAGGLGANTVSASGFTITAGSGGIGIESSITGAAVMYGGGGGGGGSSSNNGGSGATGGATGGQGGGGKGATYNGTSLTEGSTAGIANTGGGGGGGIGTGGGTRSVGAAGGSGIIVTRWITATAPIFTAPAAIDTTTAGKAYKFIIGGTASTPLTRNYRWQWTNGTSDTWGNYTTSDTSTLTLTSPETMTSGANYKYRVIVTDSDTAGLSISDTSTSFYLIINPRNTITSSTGSAIFTQKYGESRTAVFSFAFGTGTRTSSVLTTDNNQNGRITWSNLNADSATVRVGTALPVGTYYETLTVTDSVTAFTSQPISITVSKADTITVTVASSPAVVTYSSNSFAGNLTYSVTGLVNSETGTVTTQVLGASDALYSSNCATGGTCKVGDLAPGGGYVFYVSDTIINKVTGISNGGIYLATAPKTWLSANGYEGTRHWGCGTDVPGTTGLVGAGALNTKKIIDALSGCAPSTKVAAKVAADLTFSVGGSTYDDWFMPSDSEVEYMYSNAKTLAGLAEKLYWTSTQAINAGVNNQYQARAFGFSSAASSYAVDCAQGIFCETLKDNSVSANNISMRPIRAFNPLNLVTPQDPIQAGSYTTNFSFAISGSANVSNYQAVEYAQAVLTINQAKQVPLTIGQYEAYPNISSYPLNVYGGSGPGVLTVTLLVSETNTAGCSLPVSRIITATSVGSCRVQAVKAGSRNYLTETATATITWIAWTTNYAVQSLGGNHAIPLSGGNQFTTRTETVTASAFSNTSGGAISSAPVGTTIRINSTGFAGLTPSQITATFRPYEDGVVTAVTSTYVEVVIPVGAVTGVIALDSPRGVAYTPSFTISP